MTRDVEILSWQDEERGRKKSPAPPCPARIQDALMSGKVRDRPQINGFTAIQNANNTNKHSYSYTTIQCYNCPYDCIYGITTILYTIYTTIHIIGFTFIHAICDVYICITG